ncbi:hypothetical protein JTE90_029714 [Oedothorax gibbosus]|uniref:Uncharacterized protein n=1 Tax=Oedothorax gibbosus TaxID=931172 RepID=A0AAV6TJA5_9ARAC|nr:hypothetical protein JTE90_029714 [Oedothorax gibbosus]
MTRRCDSNPAQYERNRRFGHLVHVLGREASGAKLPSVSRKRTIVPPSRYDESGGGARNGRKTLRGSTKLVQPTSATVGGAGGKPKQGGQPARRRERASQTPGQNVRVKAGRGPPRRGPKETIPIPEKTGGKIGGDLKSPDREPSRRSGPLWTGAQEKGGDSDGAGAHTGE